MNPKRVITIGREYGSGGKAIGQMLADKLGLKFYDKELISLAAKHSGMCEEALENHDEKPLNAFFHMFSSTGYGDYVQPSLHQKAFLAQFETIQKLASEESCVIIGRCADYALKDHPCTTSVFISAHTAEKVELVSKLNNLSHDDALLLIAKTDKKRAKYYNYYSNKRWGAAGTYDLCLNSSEIGYSGCVDAIISFINAQEKQNK